MARQAKTSPKQPEEELSILRRRVAELEAVESALRTSETRQRWLIENALIGYAGFNTLYRNGKPDDFICMEVNKAFSEMTGLQNITGRAITEVIPGIRTSNPEIFETFHRVAQGGQPEKFETYLAPLMHWFSVTAQSPIKDHIIILFEDISRRKWIEESLRESEEHYRLLSENSTDLICLHRPDTRYTWVSPSSRDLLGYEPEELVGLSPYDFYLPEDREKVLKLSEQKVIGDALTDLVEFRIRKKDGSIIWMESFVKPLIDAAGKVTGVQTTSRDITARKNAENLQRIQRDLGISLSQAANLEDAFARILEAVFQVEGIDAGGIYLLDMATATLDLAAHRGLPDSFVQRARHYDPDSPNTGLILSGKPLYGHAPEIKSTNEDISSGEGLRALAVIPVSFEGQVIAALNLASHTVDEVPLPARDALESIAAQIGSVVARVKAEAAQRESQKNLQSLFDSINDFLFILDEKGCILQTNPVVQERLGYSAAELLGKHVLEVHPPERREEAAAIIGAMLAGETENCPVPLLKKDGGQIPVETRVVQGKWSNRDVLFGISRDISERKRSEAALQQAEENYRNIHENAVIGIFQSSPEGRYLSVNPAMARIFGYDSPREMITRINNQIESKVHADPRTREDFVRTLSEKGVIVDFVAKNLRKDGSLIWSRTNARAVRDAGGKLVHFEGFLEDITRSRQAEETLRESEEKYRVVYNNEVYAICIFELQNYHFLDVNDAYTHLYGYSREELLAGMGINDITAEPEISTESIQQTDREGAIFIPLRYHRKKDGTVFPVEIVGAPYEWKGRRVMYGMAHDISERMQAEQKLRQSEEDLHKAQHFAHVGSWKLNVRENRVEFTDEVYHILGVEKSALQPDPHKIFASVIHADDLDRIEKDFLAIIQRGDMSPQEYRVAWPDQSVHVIRIGLGEIIRDETGGITHIAGVVQDITERKHMEAELEKSEKRYREMVEHQGEGIYTTDRHGVFRFANPAVEEIFGVPPDCLVGRSVEEFLPADQVAVVKEQLALWAKEADSTYELVIIRPDGEIRSLLITATARLDENKNHVGTLGICRDITARKQTEEKLRYSSTHDALTGLFNRTFYEDSLSRLESHGQYPTGVVMIDVDGLKTTNDRFGHYTGDLLLLAVAAILRYSTRETDMVARIGGDEFVILMPSTDGKVLQQVVDRIDQNIALENRAGRHPFKISLSIGSHTSLEPGSLHDATLQADAKMYQNKIGKQRP